MNEMKERVWSVYKEYPNDTASLKKSKFYYLGKYVSSEVYVTNITYHEPRGEGDAHYCDVYFSDEDTLRLFRPDEITFQTFQPLLEEV